MVAARTRTGTPTPTAMLTVRSLPLGLVPLFSAPWLPTLDTCSERLLVHRHFGPATALRWHVNWPRPRCRTSGKAGTCGRLEQAVQGAYARRAGHRGYRGANRVRGRAALPLCSQACGRVFAEQLRGARGTARAYKADAGLRGALHGPERSVNALLHSIVMPHIAHASAPICPCAMPR